MNCKSCLKEFNLVDRIPYLVDTCCSFCLDCIKSCSKGEKAKCPKCLQDSQFNLN